MSIGVDFDVLQYAVVVQTLSPLIITFTEKPT